MGKRWINIDLFLFEWLDTMWPTATISWQMGCTVKLWAKIYSSFLKNGNFVFIHSLNTALSSVSWFSWHSFSNMTVHTHLILQIESFILYTVRSSMNYMCIVYNKHKNLRIAFSSLTLRNQPSWNPSMTQYGFW